MAKADVNNDDYYVITTSIDIYTPLTYTPLNYIYRNVRFASFNNQESIAMLLVLLELKSAFYSNSSLNSLSALFTLSSLV